MEIAYWRTATGEEVDFVLDNGHHLLAVEVKATTRPTLQDARHLTAFHEEHGADAPASLLLHCGTEVSWLTPEVLAAPWWTVL